MLSLPHTNNFHIKKSITKHPLNKIHTAKFMHPYRDDEFKTLLHATSAILDVAESDKYSCTPINQVLALQDQVNEEDRRLIVNWMLTLLSNWGLDGMAFFLSVNVFDRYLAIKKITLSNLQLVGMACLLIGSKFYEVTNPTPKALNKMFECMYSDEEVITSMETDVLQTLRYKLYYYSELAIAHEMMVVKLISEEEYDRLTYFIYGEQYFSAYSVKSPFMKVLIGLYAINSNKIYLRLKTKGEPSMDQLSDQLLKGLDTLNRSELQALKKKFNEYI